MLSPEGAELCPVHFFYIFWNGMTEEFEGYKRAMTFDVWAPEDIQCTVHEVYRAIF